MFELKDKVIIVTGGSRGIGASICELAARQGAKVVVNYVRNANLADEVVAKISAAGGEAFAFQADIVDTPAVQEMVTATLERFKRVDILVNNAGIWNQKSIEQMTDADIHGTISVNFKGVVNTIRAVVPSMKSQGEGCIINISSTAAQRGEAFHSHYAASKGAVMALTKSLASELGPDGIRVNAVSPGWTYTDMTSTALGGGADKLISEMIPLRRIGKTEDPAFAVLFLASDEASYITGVSLNVNGGSVL